jgi:hypothetical protein
MLIHHAKPMLQRNSHIPDLNARFTRRLPRQPPRWSSRYLHILLISFFFRFQNCCRLTVQIPLSALCDTSTSLVLILLENTDLLKSLHDLTVNAAAGIDVVRWAGATVLG